MNVVKNDLANFRDSLKKEGYKLTYQREAILKAILENRDEHLSSEEIYNIVSL